jgi:hypothetical protein
MKRTTFVLALCATLFILPGCTKSTQDPTQPSVGTDINAYIKAHKSSIINLIKMGAEVGSDKGLEAWAKKNPAGAKECALALSKNINDQLLPYFKDGSSMLTAEQVQELLDSSLFVNVPDTVKVAIIASSAVLDYYLPIPDSGGYLTADQKDLVAAFLEGLRAGCDDFTDPVASAKAVQKVEKDEKLPDPPKFKRNKWVGHGTGKKTMLPPLPVKK